MSFIQDVKDFFTGSSSATYRGTTGPGTDSNGVFMDPTPVPPPHSDGSPLTMNENREFKDEWWRTLNTEIQRDNETEAKKREEKERSGGLLGLIDTTTTKVILVAAGVYLLSSANKR